MGEPTAHMLHRARHVHKSKSEAPTAYLREARSRNDTALSLWASEPKLDVDTFFCICRRTSALYTPPASSSCK